MNDYNYASDCASPVPCEGKRPPAIFEVTKKNGELAADINAGMNTLLELLTGPVPCESADVMKQPDCCLLDDVNRQGGILNEIHMKLSRAIAALNG